MVFEHIEKLKQEYSDKYVVVDEKRPELGRFRNLTGHVKTVNMSGRALVQFDGYDNIGWYDIEIDYLRVVTKPEPVEKGAPAAKKKPAAKAPAGPKEPSALEKARQADAKPKQSGKMSIQDVLAAARSGSAPAQGKQTPAQPKDKPKAEPKAPTAAKADTSKMSVADVLAAARAGKGGATAKPTAKEPSSTKAAVSAKKDSPPAAGSKAVDASKMSVADVLAAARGEKSGEAPAPTKEAEPKSAAPQAEVAKQESAATVPAEQKAPAEKKAPAGDLPTETADIIAWCREHDAG